MDPRQSAPLRAVALVTALAVLAACGGGGAETTKAKNPSHSGSSSSSGLEEQTEDQHAAPPATGCGDEGCFECGSGFCLTGFYCDQNAAGGAACSWLPECPETPTCKCIERALGAGCACEEKLGGLFVTCS